MSPTSGSAATRLAALALPDGARILAIDDIPNAASRVHVMLERLRRILDAQLVETLAAQGFRVPEWRILYTLSVEGEMSQRDLVHRIVIDQALASRALARLAEASLIDISQDPSDRRRCTCRVTKEGRQRFEAVNALMEVRRDYLDGALSEVELAGFTRSVTRLASRAFAAIEDERTRNKMMR